MRIYDLPKMIFEKLRIWCQQPSCLYFVDSFITIFVEREEVTLSSILQHTQGHTEKT